MNSEIQRLGGEIQQETPVRTSESAIGGVARELGAAMTGGDSRIFRVASTVALGGFLVGPQYKLALVLALYLLVVLLRPQGLLGRA